MAMIARPNVTTVMTAVRIAEYKPTRFEALIDDSVAATGSSLLVNSISSPFHRQTATDNLGLRGLAVLPPGQQHAQTYRHQTFQAHQEGVIGLPARGVA
jgi:hypothetical protein